MRNDQPEYKYIDGILRQQIQAAVLKPRDAVPSERELTKIYGLSLMTARHALSELERGDYSLLVDHVPCRHRKSVFRFIVESVQGASKGLVKVSQIVRQCENEPKLLCDL